jgi:hypothetical protein
MVTKNIQKDKRSCEMLTGLKASKRSLAWPSEAM